MDWDVVDGINLAENRDIWWSVVIHHHHHHHHLALQPFMCSHLLSQVSPSSSILSCLLPVFNF
jgi:hypothetical protein